MPLDPRHLANLLAVVRHGSFNRAAEARGMSQPALSNSVAILEKKLNVRVMDRSKRGSSLTEYGEILARQAVAMESLMVRIEEEIRLKSHGVEGPLTVGAIASAMLHLVPDAVKQMIKQYPTVSLSVIEGPDDKLVPRLLAGEIDVLICPVGGLHPVPDGIEEEPLIHDSFGIGVGPNHRLARRKQLKLTELENEAWILPGQGSSYRRHVEAIFLTAGVPWPLNCINASSMALIEEIVCQSDRITIVSQLLTARRKRGGMVAVPLEGGGGRTIGIKRRKDAVMPPLALAFMNCVRTTCRDFPGLSPAAPP